MTLGRRQEVFAPLERASARYQPLVGILVGAVAAAVYWATARLWPSSVAVVLALSASEWLNGRVSGRSFARSALRGSDLLLLALKYNVLMALTAAHLNFPVPADAALGLIMICGQAASSAFVTSSPESRVPRMSILDVSLALVLGFAPAALLGIPGLTGLAAGILARIAVSARRKKDTSSPTSRAHRDQRLTETFFYLGALAAWKYI